MVFPHQVSRALHPGPPQSFAHPLTLQTQWLMLRTCVVLSQAPGTQRRKPRCGLASGATGRRGCTHSRGAEPRAAGEQVRSQVPPQGRAQLEFQPWSDPRAFFFFSLCLIASCL